MIRAGLRASVLLVLACAGPGMAQTEAPEQAQEQMPAMQSAVVTLDRTRLFEETLMGQAIQARIDAASNDLIAENRRLEAALEAEERLLTERRANLPPASFRDLAREFDTRVEDLRVAQEAKSRALTRMRDAEQQRFFFEAAAPVLAELMQDLGAVAIIDRSVVILSFDRIDITEQAIARLDARLGDGAEVLAAPEPQPEGPPGDPTAAPRPDAPQP
ncbi:OmpH family outer membrane protein [Pseudotabrizicola sediminis]|uniref:OmpH family outer membrane protein n=1 Tax=Pseudotabrizicola sediminis TaxID=2486418 RepID=A0ABY2KUK7_9RHOB|nr:OmpH family outer membrane protein [Pseudotabrizicola sediminis]TGD45222.1 OmpH family outer membrane protein [Pseudotabrizicola sediminis]